LGFFECVMSRTPSSTGAAMSIGGEEFRKGGVEVVGDEGGDNVLFTVRNDEKVAGTNSVKVVLPPRSWVNSWLRTIGTRGASLCVSVPCFGLQCFGFGLLVQDHSHGRNRGRGTGWNVFNEGRNDRRSIRGVSCGGDWGRDRHAVVEVRGRNGKWLGTGNRGAVQVDGVNVVR